jgi:hypothetical protein
MEGVAVRFRRSLGSTIRLRYRPVQITKNYQQANLRNRLLVTYMMNRPSPETDPEFLRLWWILDQNQVDVVRRRAWMNVGCDHFLNG